MKYASLIASALFATSVGGAEPASFEKDVKPVFRKHCVTCHNAERPRGELDLSTKSAILAGGVSGQVVISGKPEESLIYTLSAHLDTPKMPPNKHKISEKELSAIKKWIVDGLVDQTNEPLKAVPTTSGLVAVTPLPRPTTVTALAVHPKSSVIARPGIKQVLIYDVATAKYLGALPFPEGEVHDLKFSRGGNILIVAGGVGGQLGLVAGFDTTTWKRVFTQGDETDSILACDLSGDGSRVVMGGPNRTVKILSVADGKLLHTFRKPTDWVTAVGFSPDGLLVAAGDRFGTLFLWEAESGKEYATLRGHTKAITSLTWRPDGNALATASEDGTLRIWDAHHPAEIHRWNAHEGGVLAAQFDSQGQLVTSGRDAYIRLWDSRGQMLNRFGPASDHVFRINRVGNKLVSGDWAGELKIWQLDGSGSQVVGLPLRPTETSAVVLPPQPQALVSSAPIAESAQVLAEKAVKTAEDDLRRAQLDLMRKATTAAVAQLKLALSLDPTNPALVKALSEAEAAARSLSSEDRR